MFTTLFIHVLLNKIKILNKKTKFCSQKTLVENCL